MKSCATVRGLAVAAALTTALGLVVTFVLIPLYRDATGYIPFDAQPNLSQFMVGVELGAFEKGEATGVYGLYAAADALYAAATAWLFTLLWMWLFAKVPNRLFSFLIRGAILFVPFYVLVLDLAAKAGFFRLVRGLEGEAYTAAADFSVTAHRLAVGLADFRNYLTVAFLLAVGLSFLLRRGSRHGSRRAS